MILVLLALIIIRDCRVEVERFYSPVSSGKSDISRSCKFGKFNLGISPMMLFLVNPIIVRFFISNNGYIDSMLFSFRYNSSMELNCFKTLISLILFSHRFRVVIVFFCLMSYKKLMLVIPLDVSSKYPQFTLLYSSTLLAMSLWMIVY